MSALGKPTPSVETRPLGPLINEDWLSVIIGLSIFVLALAGLANVDLIGWAANTSVWVNFGSAVGTVSKVYAALGGFGALVLIAIRSDHGCEKSTAISDQGPLY